MAIETLPNFRHIRVTEVGNSIVVKFNHTMPTELSFHYTISEIEALAQAMPLSKITINLRPMKSLHPLFWKTISELQTRLAKR